MNPVVHFELPAVDRERMVAFYAKAFGWKADMLGPDMGNYVTVTTTETGPDGRPTTPGAINGGFYVKTDDPTSHAPSVVIGVDNIEKSVADVEKAGGTIHGQAQEIPGVGIYAVFIDSEGNRMSLLQPAPRAVAAR